MSFPTDGSAQLRAALEATTKAELGKRTGIHPSSIGRYANARSTPSLAHAVALERVLGIPPKDWLTIIPIILSTCSAARRTVQT